MTSMALGSCLSVEPISAILQDWVESPLERITLRIDGRARDVFLKMEGRNPGGSSKYRTAAFLIADAERTGRLHPGRTIVESTSGNLGIAFALLCSARGYAFRAVVDPKITQENLATLGSLGAQIERVEERDEAGGYFLARLNKVQSLCAESQNYIWLDQYTNPANALAHYTTTGPEIFRQTTAQADAVFVAVSTGGTLAGISRYYRQASPSTAIIAVDAIGSVALNGGISGSRLLTGIGSAQTSRFVSPMHYDEVIRIGDRDAFLYCLALAEQTGLRVGGSSGAVLAACADYLYRHPAIRHPVCVCPDRGENYRTTIFDEVWRRHAGLSSVDKSERPHIVAAQLFA